MKKIDIHAHATADDPQLDHYLTHMDTHDVAVALLHGVPMKQRDNEDVLRAVRAHPDRFFGSVHVDLREPVDKCVALVNQYADEGFRSIKVFPNFGFEPSDEHLEPFWQVVQDRTPICLSHCGWLRNDGVWARRRISSLTASPFHFEIPARRFPQIKFIFGHFGGGATYLETVVLISRLENCFADTCPGWGQWVFEKRLPGLSGLDVRKVLYGTDNAGPLYGDQETWWTETLLEIGWTAQGLEDYFYNNAARLFGIE